MVHNSQNNSQAHSQRRGIQAEHIAVQALRRAGYRIVDRNYRSRRFEIDIVATHKTDLVFVEVRGRRAKSFVHPLESITRHKMYRMQIGAQHYAWRYGLERMNIRFDIVTVVWHGNTHKTTIYPGAFFLS